MDKEFLDKVLECKTADELRELLRQRRQLSDGELEQVSGGARVGFRTAQDVDTYYNFISAVEKGIGKEAVLELLKFDFNTATLLDAYSKDGMDGLRLSLRASIR